MGLASVSRWAAALLLAALVSTTPASAGEPDVWPPDTRPYGQTYGEWSAMHWQWLYSLPIDHHPLFDTAPVSAGQSGKVWFLGGTYAPTFPQPGVILGQVTRNVKIPAGKALFFPLVDVEDSTIEGNGDTYAELRSGAQMLADFIDPKSLFCVVDGKHVKHLPDYRVQSPNFVFGPLPANNILAAPKGATSKSVSDGVFVMLEPLSPGKHTIHFGGILDASSIGFVFIQDVTYEIEVSRANDDDDDD